MNSVLLSANDDGEKCPLTASLLSIPRSQPSIIYESEKRVLNYGNVRHRASKISSLLKNAGVQSGEAVVILLPFTPVEVICVVSLLLSELVLLPIYDRWPIARLQSIIRNCRPAAIIHLKDSNIDFVHAYSNEIRCSISVNMHGECDQIKLTTYTNAAFPNRYQSNTLYIFCTSGSTGTPKFVLGTKSGALNRVRWMQDCFPLNPDSSEKMLRRTPLVFVDSISELFCALLSGIPLLLPSTSVSVYSDLSLMLPCLDKITRLSLTPSLLKLLCRLESNLHAVLPSLSLCSVSGEPLPLNLVKSFTESTGPKVELINLYGSTECAGDVCYSTIADILIEVPCEHIENINADNEQIKKMAIESLRTIACIGRAISKTTINVANILEGPSGELIGAKLLPDGHVGELIVGGLPVAIGYLNQPLNEQSPFIDSTQAFQFKLASIGQSALRTGDYGVKIGGLFYWCGRLDSTVKIRGSRVSLQYVEHKIRDVIGQSSANPIKLILDNATDQLICFLSKPQAELQKISEICSIETIRNELSESLSSAEMPSVIRVYQSHFPLNVSGKVDREALLQWHRESVLSEICHVSSPTTDERLLSCTKVIAETIDVVLRLNSKHTQSIFEGLYKLSDIGITSLNAVEIAHELRQKHMLNIDATDLLRPNLTVVDIAKITISGRKSSSNLLVSVLSSSQDDVVSNLNRKRLLSPLSGPQKDSKFAQKCSRFESDFINGNSNRSDAYVQVGRCGRNLIHSQNCTSMISERKELLKSILNSNYFEAGDYFVKVGNEASDTDKNIDHHSNSGSNQSEECDVMFDHELKWSVLLEKCVDATPLVLAQPSRLGALCACEGVLPGGITVVGSHSGLVKAIDIDSGNAIWSTDLKCRVESSPICSYDSSLVYIGGHDGFLYALYACTGTVKWSYHTEDVMKCTPSRANFEFQKVVLVGSHSKFLFCIEQYSGKLIWRKNVNGHVFSSPIYGNRTVFVATTKGLLFALDENGCEIWTRVGVSPVFADLSLVCENKILVVAFVNEEISGLDSTNGAILYTLNVDAPIFCSPCTLFLDSVELLVVGNHGGIVTCFDAKKGKILWQKCVLHSTVSIYASPFCSCVHGILSVCVASTDGLIFILDARSGNKIGEILGPDSIFSSPVLVGNQMIVGCRNDHLLCYNLIIRNV